MHEHTQILRIARAGNPARALRLFREQGLDLHKDDPKLLTLHGRLLKDHARLAAGPARHDQYQKASAAYLAAFECGRDTYPLINAAALALFADDADQARKLAQQVLGMLDADPDEGETPYWREATRAEALLLLGDQAAAETALAAGIAKLPLAHEDLAATIGQFERIIAAQQADAQWLDHYRPPSSIHFSGLIGLDPSASNLRDAIDEAIAELSPGYAYGALAAGADIMIAEAAIAFGAQLHVTLPIEVDAFRASSVEPYGEDWVSRFDALLDHAAEVNILPAHLLPDACPFALRIELASLIAMGECLRRSQVLCSLSHAVTISAPGEAERPHIAAWQSAAHSVVRIETERTSESSNGTQKQSVMQLSGVVFAHGCDQQRLASAAEDFGAATIDSAAGAILVVPLDRALKLAERCLASFPETEIGMTITVTDRGKPVQAVIDCVQSLAKAAEPGQLCVDRMTVFVAMTLNQDFGAEEIGEVSSLYGPISLWQARL